MRRNKTDEIICRLERIERKNDASVNMWVISVGLSFILFAATLFKQNPMISLFVMLIGAMIGTIPIYLTVFVIPPKKKL